MFSRAQRSLAILTLLLLFCQAAAGAQARTAVAAEANGGAKIYWSDAAIGAISRSNLDGSGYEVLTIDPVETPRGLALNVPAGSLYSINSYTDGYGHIRMGDLDGQNMQPLTAVTNELGHPNSLAVDHAGGRIFWADSRRDVIGYANLDGSDAAVHFHLDHEIHRA